MNTFWTTVWRPANLLFSLPEAMIPVGRTKVESPKQKNPGVHLPASVPWLILVKAV